MSGENMGRDIEIRDLDVRSQRRSPSPEERQARRTSLEERRRPRKRRKRRRRFPFFKLLIILLLLGILAAAWLGYVMVDKIPKMENGRIPVATNLLTSDGTKNYLIIGVDRAEGETIHRSDSMILLTINGNTKKVHMTSVLRDTYVEIPGEYNNKLNAAYAFGGVDLLEATITKNFGVQIDGSIVVNYDTIQALVDAVGGIDVTLSWEEADHINRLAQKDLVHEGDNHILGEGALWYARMRYLDDDFHRTSRQQEVIQKVLDKLIKKNVFVAKPVMDNVLPTTQTNLNNKELLEAMFRGILAGGMKDIQRHQLPIEDSYTFQDIDGMAVIAVDFPMNQSYIQENILTQ